MTVIGHSGSNVDEVHFTRRIGMAKKFVFALIAASMLLSACNTVKGLGRDIESVGEAGDKAI
jgi:predicted small secreted protein